MLPTYTIRTSFHPTGFRYTVVRIACGGFAPVLRKVFANDCETAYTGGEFKPLPRESLESFAARTQASVVVNADGWWVSGPMVDEITGCQIKAGVPLHDFDDYPKGRHALGILGTGEFRIYDRETSTVWGLLADGVTDTFVWGPPLVVDGVKVLLSTEYPESEWIGPYGITSRTMLGQSGKGDVFIVTIEGGRSWSAGAGGNVLADVMFELGCRQAILLDGGGSTQLWADGRWVQQSTDPGAQRMLASVIAVNAIRADAAATSGRIPVPLSEVQAAPGIAMTAPSVSVIEVPGARLLSIKAAFTADPPGAFWDGQLLATLPESCRGPMGSNWVYALAHVAVSGGTNGVGGICYRTSTGELRVSKDILPVHASGQRWDVTMLIDITAQTQY